MKPNFPSTNRPRRRWRAGLGLAVVLAGVCVWPALQRTRQARQALPPRPALGGVAPELADRITAADARARGWTMRQPELGLLAGLYHANSFFPEALACYRILAAREPREPRWPYLIAHLEASFGRLDAALPWQRMAATLAPADFMVHLRLGDLLLKNNALAEAESSYSRAAQLRPANPYALLGLARCAQRREDWTAARDYLRQAVAAEPGFVAAWSLLAGVEARRGDGPAAEDARRRGNGQFREIADPWLQFLTDLCYDPYQLSVAAAVTPDAARARELVERAIALAPDVSAYRRQLARMIAVRDPATARMQLERAVVLSPDDAESWSALVTLLIDTRDGRAAATALARGLKNCPQSGFLHFTNGQRLAALGQHAEAEAELQTSQHLQPAEIRGYVELSTLYVRTDRLKEAMREATAALAVDPANPLVLGMIAQLAIMQGDEAAAHTWAVRIRASPACDAATLRQVEEMYRQQFSRPLRY